LLVERGLVQSRDRARRLIMSGAVWNGAHRLEKPGVLVCPDAAIEVRGDDIPFVSRGGLKLDAALTHWQIDPSGWLALDVGASTGGFTDCLLQRGARRVVAVDVGYGQLAWQLRQDPRVRLLERVNIRHMTGADLDELADIAVVDVSFISLRLVLPVVRTLVRAGATVLPLVKPQFEAGREAVGKGGVVRDPKVRQAVVAAVASFAGSIGLTYRGSFASPVLGPKGNQEFFLHLQRP
jgi:23S rRNA (cytidine1920-2'-O)/16S rRNA (cytidine1409-2'-O)-methyltransferase